MTLQTSIKWLKIAGAGLVAFGIVMSWATSGAAAAPMLLLLDIALWPGGAGASYAAGETRLLAAIAGGLTAGTGLMVWAIARHLMPHDPALGRRILLTVLPGWFAIDGIGSVIAGAPLNVVLNAGILAMVLVPVLLVRPTAQIAGQGA